MAHLAQQARRLAYRSDSQSSSNKSSPSTSPARRDKPRIEAHPSNTPLSTLLELLESDGAVVLTNSTRSSLSPSATTNVEAFLDARLEQGAGNGQSIRLILEKSGDDCMLYVDGY